MADIDRQELHTPAEPVEYEKPDIIRILHNERGFCNTGVLQLEYALRDIQFSNEQGTAA